MTDNTPFDTWAAIERPLEQTYELPAGGLTAIRSLSAFGDTASLSAIPATVAYQIMPDTAFAVRAKYGVDAYGGALGAAEAAALILRDGTRRTGSWKGSVTQYIGGTDPARHGPLTAAYVARVTGEAAQDAVGDDSGLYAPPPAI